MRRSLLAMLVWTVVIPPHCIEPMLRMYESLTPWAMQVPYEQMLTTGRLDVGGDCTVGIDPLADVFVPLPAARAFAQDYRKDQTAATLTRWLRTFLTRGIVELPGEIVVVWEGT